MEVTKIETAELSDMLPEPAEVTEKDLYDEYKYQTGAAIIEKMHQKGYISQQEETVLKLKMAEKYSHILGGILPKTT